MKNNIKSFGRNIHRLILLGIMACSIASCSKMDDYKQFIEKGEISYTGKLDSVRVLSGKYRVVVTGLFIADPKVNKCVIYWANKTDSVVIPVTRTTNVDSLSFSINNLTEGIQNFVIYTYDADGNRSIPVSKTGRVYGDRYQGSLFNRPINTAFTDGAGVTSISWSGMDRLNGVFATDVIYKDNNDEDQVIRVPIDSRNTELVNFKMNTNIKYRTLFLPDTLSVDTFLTSYTEKYIPRFIKMDITTDHLKNTGRNFSYSTITGNRWGVLTDWTTSASVKNASNNGGWENRSNTGYISLEAGWGLPNVTDGLIYQTITLPAGSYAYESNDLIQNTGGVRYVVVAEGKTLPLVANTTGSAIAFSSLSSLGNAAQHTLSFTLSAPTEISIGYSATLTGSSGAGMYTKIGSVRLYKIEYQ